MKIENVKQYLELYHKCDEKTEEETEALIQYNKDLCERYPFLIPWNRWSSKLITTDEEGYWPGTPESKPDYDWTYTELDQMMDGWRIAFGEQMCEELREELMRTGDLENFRIVQLKEKYGTMRLYDTGTSSDSKVSEIISKYEKMSEDICLHCGRPVKWETCGWITFICDECAKTYERNGIRLVPIE